MPPRFLKKLRSKRRSGAHDSSKKSMFRHKTKNAAKSPPAIQPGITWSMSDEGTPTSEGRRSPNELILLPSCTDEKKVVDSFTQEPAVMTFTEAEVMRNELNHIRELVAKDEEIGKRENENKELQTSFNKKLVELAEEHGKELADKDNQISEIQTQLEVTKANLNEKEIELEKVQTEMGKTNAVFEDMRQRELAEWKNQLEATKAELEEKRQREMDEWQKELEETKSDLKEVSSALIQTQHKLFDQEQGLWTFCSGSWLPPLN